MRLAELSERSGVPTATIKYYLREGLLPPGQRVTATRSEYGPGHLHRLRLVRALIQVGRIPVSRTREVLEAVEREQDPYQRLGAAMLALPHGPEPEDETVDEATSQAHAAADRLLVKLGWESQRGSPPHRMLVASLTSLVRLGYTEQLRVLDAWGHAARDLAGAELAILAEDYASDDTELAAAVTLTVLGEPVLLSLRRLAQGDEACRRFGGWTPADGAGSGGEPSSAPPPTAREGGGDGTSERGVGRPG